MPLLFNSLLADAGVAPAEVRLLRHQGDMQGKTIYRLWRDHREGFEEYQARQAAAQRARFAAPYWASFVAAPERQTLFVGLYRNEACINVAENYVSSVLGSPVTALTTDRYTLTPLEQLSEYTGLLSIEWGDGARSWVQRADNQNKPIIELRRELKEAMFPGFGAFMAQLSELENLPLAWATALAAVRGVISSPARAPMNNMSVRPMGAMASLVAG